MSEPWFKTAEQIEAEREQAELARRFTYKTDIWQRVTDEEAEMLDQALDQAPAKERRLFTDSITIEHSSEYFATLKDQLTNLLSEERAVEILAPSN